MWKRKEEMSEGLEAVGEVKDFLNKVKPDLIINRVPKQALKLFKDFADDEFCSDYGFCLVSILNDALEYRKVKEIMMNTDIIKMILDAKNKKSM